MIADIRALEPKPARTFVMVRVENMIPDVLVRPSRDGGWAIELNPDALPKLLLKLQIRCGHMLALTINATAQKP